MIIMFNGEQLKMNNTYHFSNLPKEIIIMIVSNLDQRDIRNLLLVDKDFIDKISQFVKYFDRNFMSMWCNVNLRSKNNVVDHILQEKIPLLAYVGLTKVIFSKYASENFYKAKQENVHAQIENFFKNILCSVQKNSITIMSIGRGLIIHSGDSLTSKEYLFILKKLLSNRLEHNEYGIRDWFLDKSELDFFRDIKDLPDPHAVPKSIFTTFTVVKRKDLTLNFYIPNAFLFWKKNYLSFKENYKSFSSFMDNCLLNYTATENAVIEEQSAQRYRP